VNAGIDVAGKPRGAAEKVRSTGRRTESTRRQARTRPGMRRPDTTAYDQTSANLRRVRLPIAFHWSPRRSLTFHAARCADRHFQSRDRPVLFHGTNYRRRRRGRGSGGPERTRPAGTKIYAVADSTGSCVMPSSRRTRSSIALYTAGLSLRNCFAFSRP